jgi:signal transduction histidine kinase/ActR/RegA family two-component response regulator
VSEQHRAGTALVERVKELRCLYHVLELTMDEQRPIGDIAKDVASCLPQALLHPEVAVARVVIASDEYCSAGWRTPQHLLERPIQVEGKSLGRIELGYMADVDDQGAGFGPFFAEEDALLEAVATHLVRMIADRRKNEILWQSERLRTIGELTGGIAHDFNNILQVMVGTSDDLIEALDDQPELLQLARMGQSAAHQGAELTKRLLAFARQQALKPAVVDIASLVRDMRSLIARTIGSRIEIMVREPQGLWPAQIDPRQLENALLNLCLNARDAMSGGGHLNIELDNVALDKDYADLHVEVEPGEYVMLAISDDGTGMDSETLSRAIDPFFTTKETGKGSGLGLSMVFGFVKQSRGHMRIYSEPGRGTTVRLYLPRAVQPADADPIKKEAPAPVHSGENARILVVEDDDLVRRHVVSRLLAFGYDVMEAGDGPAALRILEQDRRFDLLFTDVVMPGGMDGLQLAERAREIAPDLPVLLTSGYTEAALRDNSTRQSGMVILSKPYGSRDLAQTIAQALKPARKRRSNA